MAIIEQFSSPIEFCFTSIKLYYNPVIEMDKNLDKDIKKTLLEICDNSEYQEILPTYLLPNILLISISSIPLISLIPASTLLSTLLTPAKYGRKSFQKYPI